MKYWTHAPYFGFGTDAHSFDGERRRWNAEGAEDYAACDLPAIGSTAANLDEERFFVGLRLAEGIRPNQREWRRYEAPINRFLDDGLLERQGGMLRLTDRGVLVSNEVFQEFITT